MKLVKNSKNKATGSPIKKKKEHPSTRHRMKMKK